MSGVSERRSLGNLKDGSSLSVSWSGKTFATRAAFTIWLAHEIARSEAAVRKRLYRDKWDIAATLDHFRALDADNEALRPVWESDTPPGVIAEEEIVDFPAHQAREEAAREEEAEARNGETVLETHETPPTESPNESLTPESPGRQTARGKPRGHGGTPVTLGGMLFESKVSLARHIAAQGALTVAETLSLLYAPLDDGLQRRLDYFSNRALRLRGADAAPMLGPLIYCGRWYPRRADLVRWIAEALDGPLEEARAILAGLAGDVTGEVEAYCRLFGLIPPGPDPEAPLLPTSASSQARTSAGPPAPLPAPPMGPKAETGNGHAGETSLAGLDGIAPPLPAGEPCEASLVDGSEPASSARQDASQGSDGLATTIAGHITGIVAALTRTITTTADIAPLVRYLQGQGDQLARMAARLAQLERVEADKRQALTAQADTLMVVLHKIGQISHDLGQMTRPRTPVRHTRARPLGIEPKE